jgi:membrane-bound ClpP family serine protease
MEQKSFWKTMEGEQTVAFLVILVTFFVIVAGLESGGSAVAILGTIVIYLAILYSPVRVFVLKKKDPQ